MKDIELTALVALLASQTAKQEMETQRYGEFMRAPNLDLQRAIYTELEARGVLLMEAEPERDSQDHSDGEHGRFELESL